MNRQMVSGEETVVYTDPGSRSLSHLHRCEILVRYRTHYDSAHVISTSWPNENSIQTPFLRLCTLASLLQDRMGLA
ncbi:leucyl aminopeptidase [Moniliophthora roreri]|nr:leucyl aminopeptidase [Moniliophthora roreri]